MTLHAVRFLDHVGQGRVVAWRLALLAGEAFGADAVAFGLLHGADLAGKGGFVAVPLLLLRSIILGRVCGLGGGGWLDLRRDGGLVVAIAAAHAIRVCILRSSLRGSFGGRVGGEIIYRIATWLSRA